MSLLRTIESRITTLVEGTFGRVFRTNVQPVEIARRLVKEMDDNRRQVLRNTYAPNVFDVYLSRDDFRQFRDLQAALAAELGEYLTEHARRNGYTLPTRPRVTIQMDKDLELGSFGIATRLDQQPQESGTPAQAPSHTMVFQSPIEPPADAAGAETGQRFQLVGADVQHQLDERATIGRGRSNDVVLHDSSVSREHAEVVRSGSGFVVRDLGSTNGVLLNGARVQEHELAAGDELVLGNVRLRFEPTRDGASGS